MVASYPQQYESMMSAKNCKSLSYCAVAREDMVTESLRLKERWKRRHWNSLTKNGAEISEDEEGSFGDDLGRRLREEWR